MGKRKYTRHEYSDRTLDPYESGIDTYSNFLDYISDNTGFDFGNIDRGIKNSDRMNNGTGMTNADIQSFLANQFSAEKEMNFQREMADTQWQRGVADMQAAGINPALAYHQGGAAAPSGASASSNATVFNGRAVELGFISNLVGQFMELAKMPMQMYEQAANVRNMNAQNENLKSQNLLIGAQIGKTKAEAEGIEIENKYKERKEAAEAQSAEETVNNIIKNREYIDEQINVKKQEAKTEEQKTALTMWQAAVAKANKEQIEALTPELVKLQQANTENARQQAALAATNKAIQQGLIDNGYILKTIDELQSKIDLNKAQEGYAEANAFLQEWRSSIKTGHFFDAEKWFKDQGAGGKTYNSLMYVVMQFLDGLLEGSSAITEAGLGNIVH